MRLGDRVAALVVGQRPFRTFDGGPQRGLRGASARGSRGGRLSGSGEAPRGVPRPLLDGALPLGVAAAGGVGVSGQAVERVGPAGSQAVEEGVSGVAVGGACRGGAVEHVLVGRGGQGQLLLEVLAPGDEVEGSHAARAPGRVVRRMRRSMGSLVHLAASSRRRVRSRPTRRPPAARGRGTPAGRTSTPAGGRAAPRARCASRCRCAAGGRGPCGTGR